MDERDEQQELHPAIRGLKAVCRCNNIKYRTIERAIRRGACTISQIALCTTATTGHCGGSCTPEVQAMLEEYGPKSGLSRDIDSVPRTPARPPAPHSEQTAAVPADAWWIRKE
jgi:NAD(P)H-nitrite reductase large subunit